MNLRRALLSLSTALVLAVGLAGCTPPTAPTATSTPTREATPTPVPTPEAEVRVVISTLTLEVYTGDGLLYSWAHADRDPGEIPGLTEVFGGEPVVRTEIDPGEGGDYESTYYTWPGLELRMTTSEYGPRTIWVTATAASVRDVKIEAVGGIRVGDDAQALATADPDSSNTIDTPSGQLLLVKIDQIPAETDPSGTYSVDGDPSADYVAVYADPPFATVTKIFGPTLNYGL